MIERLRCRLIPLLGVALAAAAFASLAACGGDDGGTPPGPEKCTVAGDEDQDGLADCADPDCANTAACAMCGDGNVNMGEQCDDGNNVDTDACTNMCTNARCGDGVTGPGEQCDDGNQSNTDACTNTCMTMACGDGFVQPGEACDDGNQDNTDNCTTLCRLPTCGDGFMQAGEQCDDGNMDNGDGCLNTCMTARCGDGVIRTGASAEACDDADTDSGDGCSATCTIENGYACMMEPSQCATVCGDGIIAGSETCDQGGGNVTDGDGCNAACAIEMGSVCFGMPSVCLTSCGNGTLEMGEQCDDHNMVNGDGCNNFCQFDIGCGAGETQIAVTSSMATPIMDNMTADSAVMVNSTENVSKLAVYVGSLTHTYDGDVTMALVSSRGIVRDLSSNNGGSGANYTRTFFDDAAAASITSGSAPFTGRYRPEQLINIPSAGFRGQAAGGEWKLRVADAATGDIGTLDSWTLIMCTSAQVARCGNGAVDMGEECDDGNDSTMDACNNACGITDGCGDGNVDMGEECDDDNLVSGDGCSNMCQVDIGCPAGSSAVIVANNTAAPIPDNNLATGVSSTVAIPMAGAVTRLNVFIGNLTHTYDGDIDMYLIGPTGRQRTLSTDNGSGGDNYIGTTFDDTAANSITTASAPMSGSFKPQQSLATTAGTDFAAQNAAGTWTLRVFDDTTGDTGTLNSWKILACVNPTAPYCGNGMMDAGEECDDGNAVNNDACNNGCGITDGCGDGNLDAGEACDDDNQVSGDGCSAMCRPEVTCPAGQTAVVVSNTMQAAIPDNDTVTGLSSTVMIPTTGALTSAKVYVASLTHGNTSHIDVYLDSPSGVRRELSTDNGSGANYYNTTLDDTATTTISSGSSPFNGRFKPEFSIASTFGTDFARTNANGTWTLRVFDDQSGTTGTLDSWSLLACVDAAATYCGDGMVNGGEECDDGNTNNADNCTNLCQIVDGCGDGNIDAGELCDDNNVVSGDGCSATCMPDISCPAGQNPVIVTNSMSTAIPENVYGGVNSSITIPAAGLVKRVLLTVNITHPANNNVDIYLSSPWGGQRDISTDQSGANYRGTIFSDTATTAITSGVAPYTGQFKPEFTLDYFNNQSSQGDWVLRVADDTSNTPPVVGTLDSWTLAMCVDPSATKVCGNGIVEANESCDDGNTAANDGCSAACALELNCAAGETAVVVTSADEKLIITDSNATGVTSNIAVTQAGLVTKAVVGIGNIGHTWDSDLDVNLISPAATSLDITSDNGSTGDDYLGTVLADAATATIVNATAPMRGYYKPETALAGVNGQAAMGNWGLKVADDSAGDTGVLRHWTIGLCVAP